MVSPTLPDVVADTDAETPLALQWVGMEGIAVPLHLPSSADAASADAATPAKADVYVGLDDPNAKGIHMSRLYRLVTGLADTACTKTTLDGLLDAAITSQSGSGHTAKLSLSFELCLRKPALLSDEHGFQAYPVVIRAEKNPEHTRYTFELTVPYSSTCPCSAALTRQLYATAIDERFPGDSVDKADLLAWAQSAAGSVATPHSQRSYAYLRLAFTDSHWPDLSALVRHVEQTLVTAVQTAVKRQDEQEFARLNGENLMFCEDAARRLKARFERMPELIDYAFKVEHQESLHAHNAVVIDRKAGGTALL